MEPSYDCLIIGGGPAGLSAAIYMGRFLRRTLVVDEGEGRSSFSQITDNYLGFPSGIPIRELRRLGREQAQRFGVEIRSARVAKLETEGRNFVAEVNGDCVRARTVILCTGVKDVWPDLPNVENYVGKTLFWCISCDGFRTVGKRIVLFGEDDEAATTACQFKSYTDEITFVAPPGGPKLSEPRLQALEDHRIPVLAGEIDSVSGRPEAIEAVRLKDGRELEADLMFSLYGCHPNVELARQIGVGLTSNGYVRVDHDGFTTVPGFFSAGDVSGLHTHQVCSAVHEGGEAAQTANYYLYSAYQKNEYSTSAAPKDRLDLR